MRWYINSYKTCKIAIIIAALIIAILPHPSFAHSAKMGDMAVGHLWAPPTETNTAAIYGPFLNQGDQNDRLLHATTPIASSVRIRLIKDGQEILLDRLELVPKKPLGLARWREHLWLIGLQRPLRNGDRFDLTLTFEKAGTLSIEVIVETLPGQ